MSNGRIIQYLTGLIATEKANARFCHTHECGGKLPECAFWEHERERWTSLQHGHEIIKELFETIKEDE